MSSVHERSLNIVADMLWRKGFEVLVLWKTGFPFDLAARKLSLQYRRKYDCYLIDVKVCSKLGHHFSFKVPLAWPDRARYVLRKLNYDYDLAVNGMIICILKMNNDVKITSLWLPEIEELEDVDKLYEFHDWSLGTTISLDKRIDEVAKFFKGEPPYDILI